MTQRISTLAFLLRLFHSRKASCERRRVVADRNLTWKTGAVRALPSGRRKATSREWPREPSLHPLTPVTVCACETRGGIAALPPVAGARQARPGAGAGDAGEALSRRLRRRKPSATRAAVITALRPGSPPAVGGVSKNAKKEHQCGTLALDAVSLFSGIWVPHVLDALVALTFGSCYKTSESSKPPLLEDAPRMETSQRTSDSPQCV
uniref:Uncharacterized protein n=1 Tax=Rangifer tarandus platyrhynchus TaxID=3082113 RepID=A0ACB0EII3_RANTA|nr:unnamed protein product [Rangifer tarandus platyrhynchus]